MATAIEGRWWKAGLAGPVESASGLGLATFAWLAWHQPATNLCLSPTGLALALGLALNGAGGNTYALLADALGFKKSNLETANEAIAAWRTALLKVEAGIEITIASSLWTHHSVTVRTDFISRLERWHGAYAAGLDFSEPSSVSTINAWIAKKTQGKIDQVVHSLDPATRLLLLNVLHFRGKWSEAFNPKWTQDRTFHLDDGRHVPHPLMMASGEFPYFRTEELEGIALPYGNETWRMIVLLPARGASLQSLLAGLSLRTWKSWLRRLRTDKGTILLPRFHLEATLDLGEPLVDLGLAPMFNPTEADFHGVAVDATDLAIANLLQNTFVDVDEQGTEAAAVTLLVQAVAWPPPRWQPFYMQVDRPFLFAIQDTFSASLLFLGAVYDPRAKGGIQPEGTSFVPPPGVPPRI